jgi:hypothetical protein
MTDDPAPYRPPGRLFFIQSLPDGYQGFTSGEHAVGVDPGVSGGLPDGVDLWIEDLQAERGGGRREGKRIPPSMSSPKGGSMRRFALAAILFLSALVTALAGWSGATGDKASATFAVG